MTLSPEFHAHLRHELQGIRDAGLYKAERIIATPQGPPFCIASIKKPMLVSR